MSEATLIEDIVNKICELKKFDVFLSFRGKDVRENFVKGLYDALDKKGIKAFVDSEDIVKGEDLPPALKGAIDQSRMYVVVFSKNHAGSWWCLKESVRILERKSRNKQRLLPIFYEVGAGQVRAQNQNYGVALNEQKDKYGTLKVKKWKEALTEAANMQGMALPDG